VNHNAVKPKHTHFGFIHPTPEKGSSRKMKEAVGYTLFVGAAVAAVTPALGVELPDQDPRHWWVWSIVWAVVGVVVLARHIGKG
jgi:hypothetical protein